jgi:hypothetical protein
MGGPFAPIRTGGVEAADLRPVVTRHPPDAGRHVAGPPEIRPQRPGGRPLDV